MSDEEKNHPDPEEARNIEKAILEDGRYRPEAFGFLHEGLSLAAKEIHGEKVVPGGHVSGQKLCDSLRELALERYGLMAPAVLKRWGIQRSIDFGNMVYLMIDHGFMRKTEEDSIEDFRDNFDLAKDFDTSESIKLRED